MRCQRSFKIAITLGTFSRCHGSKTLVAQSGNRPTMDRTLSRVAQPSGRRHLRWACRGCVISESHLHVIANGVYVFSRVLNSVPIGSCLAEERINCYREGE